MPDRTKDLPAEPTAPLRRSWWRRLLRGAFYAFLIFALFHRPILLFAARLVLIKIAAKQNVTLDVHFSGTIFTNLTVSGIQALPNGKGKTPVEKIAIEQVHLEYSIPHLIQHGIGEFLKTFEIHHADLVFKPEPSETKEDTEQKKSLADDLNTLLGQPALYADLVKIEDFNITVHSPNDTTEVKGINLFLHPWEPGYLKIAKISVPGLPPWENLSAETSYASRNLSIKGLQLSPELIVDEFNFDASQRAENKGSVLLKGRFFGGTLDLSIVGNQLNKKGQNLNKSYDTTLDLNAVGIDVEAGATYFRATAPPVHRLTWLKARFAGEPEEPKTWKGEAGLRVDTISAGPVNVDFAEVDSIFGDGKARVTNLEVQTGNSGVYLTAEARLPDSINDFSKTDADAELRLVLDLPSLSAPFLTPAATGGVTGGGKFGLHQQRATADLQIDAIKSGNPDYGLGGGAVKLHAVKSLDLPPNSGPLDGLEGHLTANLHDLRYTTFSTDSANVEVESHNDRVILKKFAIVRAENSITASGTYQLPQPGKPAPPAAGEFTIEAPKLESFGLGKDGTIFGGHLSGSGKVKSAGDRYSGDITLYGGDFAYGDLGLGSLAVKLHATKSFNGAPDAGPLQGLESQLTADLHDLRSAAITTDSASVEVESRNDRVVLKKLAVVRAENSISASGTYQVPQEGKPIPPITGEFAIDAPKLDSFGLGKDGTIFGGHLSGRGKVQAVGDQYSGDLALDGGGFTFGEFHAASLAARVSVEKNEANVEQFAFKIDDSNQVAFTGKAGVQAPFSYEGAVLVLFKNLSVLQPLLAQFGVKDPIGGSVDFTLESHGTGEPQAHTGDVKLAVEKAKYGTIEISQVKLEGMFAPDFAATTALHVAAKETSFDGSLEWKENRLRLKDIDLHQGTQQALSGFVLLPFEPQNTASPIPFDKRIAVNVNADKLDIEKLLSSLGVTMPPAAPAIAKPAEKSSRTRSEAKPAQKTEGQAVPVSGQLSANLVVGGTALQPTVHLKIAGRNLRSKEAEKLDPAELDATIHYSEKELTLDVQAREKDIQPLVIQGKVPVDVEAIIQQKKFDPNLPIDITVKLPPSSLAFVPKLAPTVRSISGTAGIDAHVTGTVEKPNFGGSAAVKLEYARLTNESVPGIGALDIGIGFSKDAVNIQRFKGEIGGGSFELAGKVGIAKPSEPIFDLRFRSNSVLAMRDDSITVRLDSDVRVSGPLAAGKVGGTIWVTHSRFFRDIDILPIALPGRPQAKPQPKAVESEGGPPTLPAMLAGWTFDLSIKTRPDDPFKIISNLANGAAAVDLKFGGTGVNPWLEGQVRVEKLIASLPFSKLEVKRGFITFSRDAFAEPKLEIYAESDLRDYHINVFIFGSAKDPQLSMTSQPPLPQADLISLIATGTTTSELTGNSDVLASRAAILLFQQLYHKVFKTREPSENNTSMHDRLTVDAGAVDSKTGRQELAASLRLGDKVYLVGDVDVAGQFAGRIKYLLRFR